MWRLAHRALPLGYRLLHISQNNLGDCPNCPHTTQSIEHFALKCPLSKKVWETVYKFFKYAAEPILSTIENILQATNITSAHKRKAAIWIYMTAIYEIWCWYTQARWGEKILSIETITNIVKLKMKYEINLLHTLVARKLPARNKEI